MKILILGAGQVGRTAAHHLSREEANEVTVVDTNEDVLRDLQDRLDVRTVAGNAAYPDGARSRRRRRGRHPRRAHQQRRSQHVACEVAFTLFRTPDQDRPHPRRRVHQRARSCSASDALAVDVFISPEQLVTEYVERLHPSSRRAAGARFRRRHGAPGRRARPSRTACWSGRACASCREHLPDIEARVVAIYRNGRCVPPDGDTVIEEGDEVFFLAARDDIRRVMAELRHSEDPVRRMVIAGGGNIGFRLARDAGEDATR